MPGSIQSIERAAAVLHVLGAADEPVALGDLARMVDLPKPTVHGIVRTLCSVGFAAQQPDTGRYSLGDGLDTLRETIDPHLLRSRAGNWSDGLAARTGLEVQLAVLKGHSAELLDHVFRPDGSAQRLRTGELQPVHATAVGLVLLATSPSAARLHELPLTAYTPSTLTSRAELIREVRQARRQGWASVDGTFKPGVAAVAAPVQRQVGIGVGALAVVGWRDRVLGPSGAPREELLEHLLAAAQAVSATLQDRL